MNWHCPVPVKLTLTDDPESFRTLPEGVTGLPTGPHPGAFGFRRRFHFHEGVDLYVPEGTAVLAVESGTVLAVKQFTGPELGHPWWRKTWAVWVQGASGVVLYGELAPAEGLAPGHLVQAGAQLGAVVPVLTKDKGRPMAMLHLELHQDGSTEAPEWLIDVPRPSVLRDPTPMLRTCL